MNRTLKKTLLISLITIMLASSVIAVLPVRAEFSKWDVSGNWKILVNGYYQHDYTFTMTSIPDGTFSGTGITPTPYHTLETVTGHIDGDQITFTTTYYGTDYNPGYKATFVGSIAPEGTMSGDIGSTGGITSWVSTDGIANSVVHVTIGGEPIAATVKTFVPGDGNNIPDLPGQEGLYFDILVDSNLITGKVKVCLPYDTKIENPHLYMYDPVDFNNDGTVNGQDISAIQKEIRSKTPDTTKFDVNHDGYVNNADLLIVKDYAKNGIIVNQGQGNLPEDSSRPQARLPWMDITAEVNTETGYVCGFTDHFSGFGVR